MLRQLGRLIRPVGGRPEGPVAPAVYARLTSAGWVVAPAADQGFEGVACVDDAARAGVLYCAIWRRNRQPWARETAERLLTFVVSMQEDDGRFGNFIVDWDGRKNLTGPTSAPASGMSWTVRAMHALACGAATFPAGPCAAAFDRGLTWICQPIRYLDLRALAVLALLVRYPASWPAGMAEQVAAWADEMAASRLGDRLPDVPGHPEVHLWGHVQEAVLARVGQRFGRGDLIAVAAASARDVLMPPARRGFDTPTSLPFEASSVVFGLDTLARVTGDDSYAEHATLARAWFDGRNTARRPVYDRMLGVVYDGIDNGRINADSGAEANIEGGLALISRSASLAHDPAVEA
jgi:hypothetical protein